MDMWVYTESKKTAGSQELLQLELQLGNLVIKKHRLKWFGWIH